MDSMNGLKGGLKDSLMERVMENLVSNEHEQKQHSVSTFCGTVSSAMCQACFAGMRSVTGCLATLFCPKPEFRHKVYCCERHIIVNNELVVPLLSGDEQSNQNRGAVMVFCGKDSKTAKTPGNANFVDVVDVDLFSLPSLGPIPYDSIPEEAFTRYLDQEKG